MRQLKRNSNHVEQVRCSQASSNAPGPNGVGVSLDFLHRLAEARPKPFAALGENGGRRRRNVLFWTDPIPVSSSRYFGADRSLIGIIYAICNVSCLSAGMGLTRHLRTCFPGGISYDMLSRTVNHLIKVDGKIWDLDRDLSGELTHLAVTIACWRVGSRSLRTR